MKTPVFNTEFICIADRKHANLAAIVASYLFQEATFLSIFEFPSITVGKPLEFTEVIDENYISKSKGEEISIRIHNGIRKIGRCEFLVLIGLSANQKSYLAFLNEYDIIEIDSEDEVGPKLGGFAVLKECYLSVKPEDVLLGLLIAGREQLKLRIDNLAEPLLNDILHDSGILVIENNNTTSVVSGNHTANPILIRQPAATILAG